MHYILHRVEYQIEGSYSSLLLLAVSRISSSTFCAKSSSYLAPLAGLTGSGFRPRISSSTICEIEIFFEDSVVDDVAVHVDIDEGGEACRDFNL